jgi:DNA-directed RNA polymerase subunit RPC12/RpoP
MTSNQYVCEDCESEFIIKYDEEVCESDPLHCPFCSAYLLDSGELNIDEE